MARGTKTTTRGFRRITRLGQPVKIKVLGFFFVVIFGTVLISWITRTAWIQLERLRREHSAVKSESFYSGVTLRSSLRSLNGKLLEYGLTHDPAVRTQFLKESQEVQQLINNNRQHLREMGAVRLVRTAALNDDLELLDRAERSYTNYLALANRVLAPPPPGPDLDSFSEVYLLVQAASAEVLGFCDRLVAVQNATFGEFLGETQKTLVNHKRLLELTSMLILALAGTLTILVYRGMIAPLRRGLTQSKNIIERQEKLASLGVLASGVAHEIRNPLTAIKFRLFSMKKAVPGLAENEDALIVDGEINRLERIVKDFLRFARPSEPQLTNVEAGRILKDVHDLMQGQLQRMGVQLETLDSPAVWVFADPQQLKQVLINLVRNAAEAIPGKGRIILRVRTDDAELEGDSTPAAILSVTDNGNGIPPEIESRLFDPFFTTKGGGTGLGLAIAARIVEKHGGMLRYETEVNEGTTFEVVLPRINDETETPADRG